MKKLPISVCIISGAEVRRLGRALESVAAWTQEIIVVLNEEVRDGTEELAQRYGAVVYREPWKGFVAQKNSALAKAGQPWVLGLDADEVVSPPLRDEIAQRLTGQAAHPAAYSLPRCTFYFGRWIRHGDWYPDRCIRLWQRERAKWVGVDPHARLEVEGTVGKLHQDLLHYTTETLNYQITKTVAYADDFARHASQTNRQVHFGDLLVRPAWRFVRGYVFKLGFLDGWQGYSIAWLTAFYTFLRYARAREAQWTPDPISTREP